MQRRLPRKILGDRAECAFQFAAVGRGFIVSKPYGESAPYDFIVQRRVPPGGQRQRRLWRVQVKSVTGKDSQGRYTVNTRRSGSRSYGGGELDVFACWIAPLNGWYVIPAARVGGRKCVHLYPSVKGSRGRYEKYREAWRLLG